MNASRITFRDVDQTPTTSGSLTGIFGISVITARGPFGNPDRVIQDWNQYKKIFGGLMNTSDDPLIAKVILDRGGKLRINRVGHYVDVTDAATLDAVKPAAVPVLMGTTPLFTLRPKYAGSAYNNLKVVVSNPSNGLTTQGFFNLRIYILGEETDTNELYENLIIPGKPTIDQSNYLQRVIQNSQLVDVTYNDLSAATPPAPIVPIKSTLSFTGGSNGTAPVATDYIGDTSGATGFHAFDAYDDITAVATPSMSDGTINNAGAAYAEGRQDLHFFAHLDHNIKDVDALITERSDITLDTKYTAIFTGGQKVKHPITNQTVEISEIGAVLGVVAYVDELYGPWRALNNIVWGQVPNSLGVATNFGSPGDYNKRNQLAQRQINLLVQSDGVTHVAGNYSAQLTDSQASLLNVSRLISYIKKSIRPTLTKYIGRPADIPTFKELYNEVNPFLQFLADARAFYATEGSSDQGYKWEGDQDARNMSELRVNTPEDLAVGIYRINLFIKPVGAINEIEVTITLTQAGVQFDTTNLTTTF